MQAVVLRLRLCRRKTQHTTAFFGKQKTSSLRADVEQVYGQAVTHDSDSCAMAADLAQCRGYGGAGHTRQGVGVGCVGRPLFLDISSPFSRHRLFCSDRRSEGVEGTTSASDVLRGPGPSIMVHGSRIDHRHTHERVNGGEGPAVGSPKQAVRSAAVIGWCDAV